MAKLSTTTRGFPAAAEVPGPGEPCRLPPPEEEPDPDKEAAAEFLARCEVRPGDAVAMIGVGNPEIAAAVLRGGGKLIIREFDQALVAELQRLAERCARGMRDTFDIQTGDFTALEPHGPVKLVFYPHILDDPRINELARVALIRKACELVQGGGFVAVSLDQVSVKRETIEQDAAGCGFKLELVGAVRYGQALDEEAFLWHAQPADHRIRR